MITAAIIRWSVHVKTCYFAKIAQDFFSIRIHGTVIIAINATFGQNLYVEILIAYSNAQKDRQILNK